MKKRVFVFAICIIAMLCTMLTASAGYLGDVNGDGKITAADARLTLRASARIEALNASAEKNADVNKDGKVNASDARMILRVSAKIDDFQDNSSDGSSDSDTTVDNHICTMGDNGKCRICGKDMIKLLEDMTNVLERDKVILEYYNKMIDATSAGKYKSAATYAARIQSEINNARYYAKRHTEMAKIYQIYDELYNDYKALLDSKRGSDRNINATFSNMYDICMRYDLDAHKKITEEFRIITIRHFGDYITVN